MVVFWESWGDKVTKQFFLTFKGVYKKERFFGCFFTCYIVGHQVEWEGWPARQVVERIAEQVIVKRYLAPVRAGHSVVQVVA